MRQRGHRAACCGRRRSSARARASSTSKLRGKARASNVACWTAVLQIF